MDEFEDNEMDFIPDAEEPQPLGMGNVKFEPASTAADFQSKAKRLLSNAMDFLNAKIESEMAEAADIKTAVDIGKHFKIGIETVDEAAKRAMAEAASYLEPEHEDDTADDSMRFSD